MKKETKKMIYLQERDLIDRIASDEAIIDKRPISGILEQHLLNSMLPQNKDAASFVRLLYGDDNLDIRKTFIAIFEYLSAGIDWKSTQSNVRPLVSLFHSLGVYSNSPTGEEIEWGHAISQLESIATKIQSSDNQKLGSFNEFDYVKDLISIISNNPSNIRFTSLTGLLLENWDCLKNYTRTYRFLVDVASMQRGMQNSEEHRINLVQILKEISLEW